MSEIHMSLAGVSCQTLGLHCKTHRPILPELNDSLVSVSGRDGSYDYQNNTYQDRLITVDFFISRTNFTEFRLDIRKVAAWLRRRGEIRFSDEPDKYYFGRCYQSPMLEQAGAPFGTFSATFLCEPFAYGAAQNESVTGSTPVALPIHYEGMYPTCCRIIIRNTGNTIMNGLRIRHSIRTDEGGN